MLLKLCFWRIVKKYDMQTLQLVSRNILMPVSVKELAFFLPSKSANSSAKK